MAYQPFDARVYPIFIYYIILSIFGIFITIKMFMKWRERKVPAPLQLAMVFTCLTSAIIVLAIGLAEAAITGYYKEIYRLTLPLAYTLVVFADIFLFFFVSRITEKGKNLLIPLIIIGIILIFALFLPSNYWGTLSEDYKGKLNTRLYVTLSFVLYCYFVYISIAVICYSAKKVTSDQVSKLGLSLLFYSMISMILFFIMIIADTMLVVLFYHPGYSEFIYVAWIFAVLFLILSYFSLVMPQRLVDWIEKREEKS